MNPKPTSFVTNMSAHFTTVGSMFRYFSHSKRRIMLPILLFLMVSGVLLVATGGISYVAPFVYAVF